MSQRYPGGFITQNPTAPSNVTARGIWTLDQAVQNIRAGTWPATPKSGPPNIGGAYEGGFYAGEISTAGNGVADFYLVVAPVSSGQNNSKQWKTTQTSTTGTSSAINGPTNSANMNDASHPAAEFCEGLSIGGYSDWYMPARNELEVCYYNLKPTTGTNSLTTGANANAVPSRNSNYTGGDPPQTSAAAFQSGGAEAFGTNDYWSSTENSATLAWDINFTGGAQGGYFKTNGFRVRAVRRVAV
jgi:hypothetical protein